MIRYLAFISFFLLSINAYAQGSNSQGENNKAQASEKHLGTAATAADILTSLKQAEEAEPVMLTPVLTGSAELGFLYKTGNSNSGDMKSGVDLHFENGRWLSLLNVDLLIKKADVKDSNGDTHFETTDQKWTFTSQTNYSLDSGEKNYIFGNVWYEDSEFNSFVSQSSVSTGWGRHWYKSKQASLWADIGPGYKRDLFRKTETDPEKTEDSWIVQMQALYIRKLGEHVEFKQFLSAKHALSAADNSVYKAETSVTTKLISTLQLKFTFTVDYNTKVEENKENMDTQTAVTLVYSF
ncbi:MAG: DUF481 domain-containing protein [Colwellia sp.]|nr:DUF481 domain-containing protein [Colwellia sp.]